MEYSTIEKRMSNDTFYKFRDYIEGNIGICIPDSKKVLVESRLLKRLRALNYSNYDEYSDYFFSKTGSINEVPRFVECITTNKTDFFREDDHFDFLTNIALKEILKLSDLTDINLWSGASSSGEEAYTMAMVTDNFLEEHRNIGYKVLATDISEKVLNIGREGIYPEESCKSIPYKLKQKYCLKSRDRENPTVKIDKKIRDRVMFRKINLTDDSYNVNKLYHVIFLRNVLIYFNKETQKQILNNFHKYLHPKGFLFLGHSENLPFSDIPFERIGSSIYKKK